MKSNWDNRVYWRAIVPIGILFAVICQTVATYCGLGITFDSNLFLEGAAYFRGDVTEPFESLLIFQSKPPLFPFFLFLIPFFGSSVFYGILLIVNLVLIAALANRIIENSLIRSIGFLSIAGFAPLVMVHVYLWTEPVFMVFFLSTLLILVGNEKLESKKMLWLILFGVSMILIRHVALFIIIGIGISLLLNKQTSMKWILIYLGSILLVFFLWSMVFAPTGLESRITTLRIPIDNGNFERTHNLFFYLDAVSKWFLPNSLNQTVRVVLVVTGLGFLLALFVGLRKNEGFARVQSLVIIAITYYVFMHLAFKIYPDSAERYLVPIYPISIVSIGWLASSYLARNANLKKLVIVIMVIWLIYPLSRTVKNAAFWKEKICSENLISITYNSELSSKNQLQNVTLQPLGKK